MVDYEANSSVQKEIVRLQAGRIRALVERLGFVQPELKIVDYGCGPGTSAIEAVVPAIEAYRERFPRGRISVCHADLPGNDWNALFELATGPSGYRTDDDAVRTEAAIGSFYDPMVADGSVTLGTSFSASHWLSQAVPVRAPGTVWFADLRGQARAVVAAMAQRDWSRFLHCRASELRPGGFLLVSTLGAVPEEREANGAAASGRGIYRALQRVAQRMADEGLIDPGVLDRFVFGLWFMTAKEARHVFECDAGLAKTFDLEHIEVEPAPVNPSDIFREWLPDPVEYARRYTGYARAFADSSLRTHLFRPSAGDEGGTDELAREFYRRLEELYRTTRDRYACEVWVLTVVLRRSS